MNELIITEKSNLTAIADAVRNKTGVTASMTLGAIANSIYNIETKAKAYDIITGVNE